jgi:hypothetical protein
MFTLWGYCKQRYASNDLKSQTQSLPTETRQSLTQKIVETLNAHDEEDGSGDNVECMLAKLEVELEQGNQQLKHLEDKEEFLVVRIRKYQELLKAQDEHLQNIKISTGECESDQLQQQQQQQQYQEKLNKQQKNKEALGKVLDVHLTIVKKMKDCKRTIATLEQKKHELTNVTKACRQFLVLAEEAEREQQLGIVNDDEDEHDDGLQLVEHASTHSTDDAEENDCRTKPLVPEAATEGSDTQEPSEGSPTATGDDGIDLEASTAKAGRTMGFSDDGTATYTSVPSEDVTQVEPEERTVNKDLLEVSTLDQASGV